VAAASVLLLSSISAQPGAHRTPSGHSPIALHQLVVVPPGSDALVPLRGYDLDGDKMKATIKSLPEGFGVVHQLSKVFSDYGYEPKKGVVAKAGADVTGSQGNRVYYKRPASDSAPVGKYGVMTYTVSDLSQGNQVVSTSPEGMVTFVPPSGVLVGSHFSRGAEGWTIVGNLKGQTQSVIYEASSRGALNHYVYGSDDTINSAAAGQPDKNLWYFNAPPKFLGHHGIAYGGSLQFTLSSFHGDFSAAKRNTGVDSSGLHLVELHCAKCNVNRGVTLAFPASKAHAFTGAAQAFSLALKEGGGWVEDPKNTLKPWRPPTQCTFIQVLSGLSELRILGDFTSWYESVALDTFQLVNLKAQVPQCAQLLPDASRCTCSPDAYANTVVRPL